MINKDEKFSKETEIKYIYIYTYIGNEDFSESNKTQWKALPTGHTSQKKGD